MLSMKNAQTDPQELLWCCGVIPWLGNMEADGAEVPSSTYFLRPCTAV